MPVALAIDSAVVGPFVAGGACTPPFSLILFAARLELSVTPATGVWGRDTSTIDDVELAESGLGLLRCVGSQRRRPGAYPFGPGCVRLLRLFGERI